MNCVKDNLLLVLWVQSVHMSRHIYADSSGQLSASKGTFTIIISNETFFCEEKAQLLKSTKMLSNFVTMVWICLWIKYIYGSLEIDEYVRSQLYYLICLRHLIRSIAVTNRIFCSPIFLQTCATSSELSGIFVYAEILTKKICAGKNILNNVWISLPSLQTNQPMVFI